MLCGFEVPIDRLAFSQPTAQGSALARAYTSTQRILVYEERPGNDAEVSASTGVPTSRPDFVPSLYDIVSAAGS